MLTGQLKRVNRPLCDPMAYYGQPWNIRKKKCWNMTEKRKKYLVFRDKIKRKNILKVWQTQSLVKKYSKKFGSTKKVFKI